MLYTGGMDDKYITTAEAGQLLGVGGQRIRDLIKIGRLRAVKAVTGVWMVERESVLKFKPKPHGRPRKNA